MEQWRVLQPGEVFAGRYRIDSVLGVGGFAHVYRATQMDLGRPVAIKVLRPARTGPSDDPAGAEVLMRWSQRFRREAVVISKLRDPHTITMYDYGETEDAMSFMAFEYVAGQSLDRVIAEEGPMSPDRVIAILRQCLYSLQEAHAMGVLHRDIKPANVLLYDRFGRRNQVKVLDFGIAKPIADDALSNQADLTSDGSILGTPRYMAPEQLRGETIGPPSDLYSLGLMAYELLAGRKAIDGQSSMTVISQQLRPEPILLPLDLAVPRGLRNIVHAMLAKTVAERYQSALEVLNALESWEAQGEPIGGHPTSLLAAHESPQAQYRAPEQYKETRPVQDPGFAASKSKPAGAGLVPFPGAPPGPEVGAATAGTAPHNAPKLLWVGVGVAVVVVAALVAVALVAVREPGSSDKTVPPLSAVAPAPTVPALPAPAEPPAAPAAPAAEPAPAPSAPIRVTTNPGGATIVVGGVVVGTSPLEISAAAYPFPLTIGARLADGRQTEAVLAAPAPSVELVFAALEAPAPEKAPAKAPARPPGRRPAEAAPAAESPKPANPNPGNKSGSDGFFSLD